MSGQGSLIPTGTHANAWDAAATGAGGVSNAIDISTQAVVSAFGHVDGATTITLQVSQNNSSFYDTATTVTTSGVADFHMTASTGANYARLKSSGAVTATATIAGKG